MARYTNSATTILSASYQYNGLGQRVVKQLSNQSIEQQEDNGDTVVFHYDSAGKLLQTSHYNAAEHIKDRHYVWLGDMPLAFVENDYAANGSITDQQVYYIAADHLNTPRIATSDGQEVTWRWQSGAFGTTQAQTDPDNDGEITNIVLRFPGQVYDVESGVHYNYFRDYEPVIGRYVQSDPIGLMGGVNTYGYVFNNPLTFFDPLGLDTQVSFGVSGTAFFGGGVSGGASVVISTNGSIGGTRVGVSFQANALVGVGAFAGVGVSGGISHSDGQTHAGINTSQGFHAENNIALGVSGGSSIDGSNDGGAGVSGGGGRLGVGLGVMPAAVGVGTTSQILSPSLGEIAEALFGESLPGRGGRYRDPSFSDYYQPPVSQDCNR